MTRTRTKYLLPEYIKPIIVDHTITQLIVHLNLSQLRFFGLIKENRLNFNEIRDTNSIKAPPHK